MNKILIFAGAGISAESGLNTFRDTGGIWTKYDVNEVCNIHTFKQAKNDDAKRKKIFEFYNLLKECVKEAKPNEAHKTIAKWQKKYGESRVVVVTANVDDLFEKAGVKNVVHVHGDLRNMQCTACANHWQVNDDLFNHTQRCPKCNSRLTKPAVVFFGEQAPRYMDMNRTFSLKHRQEEDIVMCIGSSMSVIGPDRIVENPHHSKSKNTILINKEETIFDSWFKHVYYGLAGEQIKKVESQIIQNHMYDL